MHVYRFEGHRGLPSTKIHRQSTRRSSRTIMATATSRITFFLFIIAYQQTISHGHIQPLREKTRRKIQRSRKLQESLLDFIPGDLLPVPVVPTETPQAVTDPPFETPTLPPSVLSDENASLQPTARASKTSPSPSTTITPSVAPTPYESESPSASPSEQPSETPSEVPSKHPTSTPSMTPSELPSEVPSFEPSEVPSESPSSAPSVAPSSSVQPSTRPTEKPSLSLMPSELPSEQPSSQPSTSAYPSEQPSSQPSESAFPSAAPSETPSSVPTVSAAPSELPSTSPSSSPMPSEMPSEVPSPAPSISPEPTATASASPSQSMIPSDVPSEVPSQTPTISIAPSGAPSFVPTSSARPTVSSEPSELPSESPSDQPSSKPSESSYPSTSPSESPSSTPTISPSAAPSPAPSVAPSAPPSSTPSAAPSEKPSDSPTPSPSAPPSAAPSAPPSSSPSSAPSTSPTLECHDISSYRSPINDFSCENHRGTDCVQWRFLGLNTTELGDLIDSCPEACDIECGSFTQFSIPVAFRLSSIPGLLDKDAKKTLEDVASNYVLAFAADGISDVIFDLDTVVLSAQSPVEQAARLRRLQANGVVDVSVIFTGFALYLDHDAVSELLVSAIENTAFTNVLQASTSFYSTVFVSSASEAEYAGMIGTEDKAREGASSATIAVSALISGSILFFGVGSFIYHRHSGKWVPWASPPELRDADDSDDDICLSPRSNARSSVGLGSPPNSLLSFDTSSGMQAGVIPGASTLVRLIASLSLSRSKSSTEEDNSESEEFRSTNIGTPDPAPPLISPMSDETDNSFHEHPLASIIPPMIVIDHIEEDYTNLDSNTKRKKQQVPSRHVEASSDFISALRGSHSTHDQSMLFETNELDLSTWTNGQESTMPLSPIGIDSDSDDENSVASTPVHSTSSTAGFPLRRTLSSSALEDGDRRRSTDLLTPRPLALGSPPESSPGENEGEWGISGANEGNPMEFAYTMGPQMPATSPLNNVASSTGSVELQKLPPFHPSTPGDRSARSGNSPSESGRLLTSLWGGLSPISKAFKEATPRTLRRPSFPKRSESNTKRKAPSESSDDDEHSARRSLHVTSDSAPVDKQIRYEFETPRKGQLGLVIEASKEGPIVRAVKDYSPLFGLVKKGDRIVEVDGKKTLSSTLTEITRLLAVRPNRRSNHLRIAITRSILDQNIETQSSASPRHSRGSSYGSTSDADAPSDDLLKTSYYSDHSSGGHHSSGGNGGDL